MFVQIFQLDVDGVALRLMPEASQIRNALTERKKTGIPDESFAGVPVFQLFNVILVEITETSRRGQMAVLVRIHVLESPPSKCYRINGGDNRSPGVTGGLFCLAAEYIFRPCGVSGFTQPSTRLRTSQSIPTVRRVSSTLRLASATSERIPTRHRVPVRSPIRNAHVRSRLSARSP
ncbi:UNVERIFIED_CONTAM: protein -like, chloroplastic [Sesamum latifolium]|uniref:Protein -like, chloroplastic n=1 Tax=Sesamum latifolium TaxID=2727402 RepID=A0AAW2XD12_9LAMI